MYEVFSDINVLEKVTDEDIEKSILEGHPLKLIEMISKDSMKIESFFLKQQGLRIWVSGRKRGDGTILVLWVEGNPVLREKYNFCNTL